MANSWKNEFISFKRNIPKEKALLMRRFSRSPDEENKIRKLTDFQNEKMNELEQKVEMLNEEIAEMSTPSQFKIVLKGCWAGASAYAIPTGIGAAVTANPFLGVIAAITAAVGAVCSIVEANVS